MTVMPVDGNMERVNVQKLCGDNTGQHLYIHLERETMMRQESFMMMMPVMIRFNFGDSKPYSYNIKVTQVMLMCYSRDLRDTI